MSVTSSTSIHGMKTLKAWSTRTGGAPLLIEVADEKGVESTVTIFTDDQDFTDDLITMINLIARKHGCSEV